MINYHTYHNSQLSIFKSQLNKLVFFFVFSVYGRVLWRKVFVKALPFPTFYIFPP